MDSLYDVVVIGGGINGCGCAADAAQRGLKVLLCEQSDIGSKTSSSSSKLIHGGLRYLENGDIFMVRKALKERQRLIKIAPHIIRPIPFILPRHNNIRPDWILKAGLFLYDNLLIKKHLPKSKKIYAHKDLDYFAPLNPEITRGFIYSDCITDDSRLVIENAIAAKNHGATILSRTKLVHAQITDNIWELALQNTNGKIFQVRSKSIINSTGPWVESVSKVLRMPLKRKISKVKGSHIIVPALYKGTQTYVLQSSDKRIIFVIPYYNHTLIGTTEINYTGSLSSVTISTQEIDYLLKLTNEIFKQQLNKEDIIHQFSGVRPLIYAKGKTERELSRDFDYEFTKNPAPLITVYGGKITTYRILAEKIINNLTRNLTSAFPKLKKSATACTPLPGSSSSYSTFEQYTHFAAKKYFWLNKSLLERYLKTYGTHIDVLLKNCSEYEDLGLYFGDSLYQAEVDYLIAHEWAMTIDDILWRRTKLGLTINSQTRFNLNEYLQSFFNSNKKQPTIEVEIPIDP